MKIQPVGHRLLIEQDAVKEVSAGGIIVTTAETMKREQQAQSRGTVRGIGQNAWAEFDEPWCKVGDRILYQRHSGMRISDENGEFIKNYILINDLDVTGVITEEEVKDAYPA